MFCLLYFRFNETKSVCATLRDIKESRKPVLWGITSIIVHLSTFREHMQIASKMTEVQQHDG